MRHRFALLAFFLTAILMPLSALAQWAPDGTPVCTSGGFQNSPKAIPDGVGGTIITWEDNRSGNSDIYAQRMNALGVPQWTANGVKGERGGDPGLRRRRSTGAR